MTILLDFELQSIPETIWSCCNKTNNNHEVVVREIQAVLYNTYQRQVISEMRIHKYTKVRNSQEEKAKGVQVQKLQKERERERFHLLEDM